MNDRLGLVNNKVGDFQDLGRRDHQPGDEEAVGAFGQGMGVEIGQDRGEGLALVRW